MNNVTRDEQFALDFKEKFDKIYEGKRLLSIGLDGFSHSVWFDSGTADSEVEQHAYSAYAPEQKGNGFNSDEAIKLFKGTGHMQYQNNATQILYVSPDER